MHPRQRTLPAELWDAILDHVTDTATLCACSVVCRKWSPRARRNLLRTIQVSANGHRPQNAMSIACFCRVFGTADPHARALVTALDIGDFSLANADVSRFLDVLELFCGANVRHLTLRYCYDRDAKDQLFDVCRLAFSGVTSLDLNWTFNAVSEFSALASQFPCLEIFVIRCLVMRDHGRGEIHPPTFKQCRLHFELPSTCNILTYWAAHCISRFSEIWVCLEEFTYEILCNICEHDRGILERVKSLAFVLDGHEPDAHYDWSSLAERLEQCTQLEELTFSLASGYRSPVKMLLDRLETVFRFPPTVKRITIDGDPHWHSPLWEDLEPALATMFPLLEEMPEPIRAKNNARQKREDEARSQSEDEEDNGLPLLGHQSMLVA
ncbi:hypothetical protein EXIGLDRAFT_829600 [Exidia glandulosa HHB12029]|uniref:F-box domain-containing protein n=1 Tax=Exidia glandulosa HHB12029 TaxID=1314781 RepID=A0A165PDX5_EXIGL|nr:hypothetical protein EXIGLDRAFT_829600 [Exidia glandulosa HHB12029]